MSEPFQEGVDEAGYPYNQDFLSRNPSKVAGFFSHFQNELELFEWVRNRPKGKPDLVEVKGDTRVVVVIPTFDSAGQFARNCRESIFAGQQIIFVDSHGKPDPFFNLAHFLNVGLRRALTYDPKWIVYSNDDMVGQEPIYNLVSRLMGIENDCYDVLFTSPRGSYHSVESNLGQPNSLRSAYFSLNSARRSVLRFERLFRVTCHASRARGMHRFFFHRGYQFVNFCAFGIFSPKVVESAPRGLMDEAFLAGGEDVDLSLRLTRDPTRVGTVPFRISALVGGTSGRGDDRRLRDLLGHAYLSHLMRQDPERYFLDPNVCGAG